ncbi:MAG TPA: GNAT family N-acetyltransferase [Acidobacteriota bacterium]|nr:GNAT family N-acetyltransferase [Acidobacteriota bacterium]
MDRTEHVTLNYVYKNGRLEPFPFECHIPPWTPEPGKRSSVRRIIDQFAPILERGGVMLGVIDNEQLVGFAILRYDLEPGMAQLAALFVGNGYRRHGLATKLTAEVIRRSRADGAKRLYVSATPSESAVGFYRSQGFELAEKVNKELYALEPEDIHMILDLA